MNTPPLRGGQGRSPEDLEDTATAIVCTLCAVSVALLLWLAIYWTLR